MGNFNKPLLIILLLGLLSGCAPAVRNSKGLYEYSYCTAVAGQASVLGEFAITDREGGPYDSLIVQGIVKDLKYKEPVSGATVYFTSSKYKGTSLTDTNGYFIAVLPEDNYSIKIPYIGCSNFEMAELPVPQDQKLTIYLGEAGGFKTYGISSKHKLMTWQLKRAVKRIRKVNKNYP